MLTPEGLSAQKMDKVMLLARWATFLAQKEDTLAQKEDTPVIRAGMGKPTHPLLRYMTEFLANYWIKHTGEAVDYGHPQGDKEARTIMAEAMSKWYGLNIEARNILFTVGGAGALRSIFCALSTRYKTTPNFRVITPFPYYSLYNDSDLSLHPIHVMSTAGYRLTAENLLSSIKSAYTLAEKDNGYPKALLLCDPNNPLGSALGEEELKKIAEVLIAYPDLIIILDEAYAEMVLDGTQHVSLLTIAPDLRERIILMRSATKGLSAAGERMAITIAFNEEIMNSILQQTIRTYGHAPRSSQMAYAETMKNFSDEDRIKLNNFYRPKVEYIKKRLVEIGASMPDKDYQVTSTFYILADLSELLEEPIPKKARSALGKEGLAASDEDIVYLLLFLDSLMVAPGSYFGLNKKEGYVRITCSGTEEELCLLMKKIEQRLTLVRSKKYEQFKQEINQELQILEKIDLLKTASIRAQLQTVTENNALTPVEQKERNTQLKQILLTARHYVRQATPEGRVKAATVIQNAYRAYKVRKATQIIHLDQENEWQGFVNRVAPKPSRVRTYLLQLSAAERLGLIPWQDHLQKKDSLISPNFLMDLIASPAMNNYAKYLALIITSAGIIGLCILAAVGFIGTATVAVLGGGAALMGIGFFSTKPKNETNESNVPSLAM